MPSVSLCSAIFAPFPRPPFLYVLLVSTHNVSHKVDFTSPYASAATAAVILASAVHYGLTVVLATSAAAAAAAAAVILASAVHYGLTVVLATSAAAAAAAAAAVFLASAVHYDLAVIVSAAAAAAAAAASAAVTNAGATYAACHAAHTHTYIQLTLKCCRHSIGTTAFCLLCCTHTHTHTHKHSSHQTASATR
jgi:hypothetical protein